MRGLPQNIQATIEGHSHQGWVPPTLGQTQHYNMLRTIYLKAPEQQQKVIHTGVGDPPLGQTQHYNALRVDYPKTPEQQRRSSTPRLGTPHSRSNSTL